MRPSRRSQLVRVSRRGRAYADQHAPGPRRQRADRPDAIGCTNTVRNAAATMSGIPPDLPLTLCHLLILSREQASPIPGPFTGGFQVQSAGGGSAANAALASS